MVTNEFETNTEENFDLKRKSETTRHDGARSNQPRHPDRPSFGDTRLSAYNQTDPSLRFSRAFRGASSPFNRVYGEKSWCSPPHPTTGVQTDQWTRVRVSPSSQNAVQPPSQTTNINMGAEQRAFPAAPPPPSEAEVTAEEVVQAEGCKGVPKPLSKPPGVFLVVPTSRAGACAKQDSTTGCFHAFNIYLLDLSVKIGL